MLATGGAAASPPSDSGVSGTGGTGGQSATIQKLPADGIVACTYTQSGPEHVITAYRDATKTSYYLASNLSTGIVVHPVGTPDSRIFVDRVDKYEYLYVDILPNGLIRFVDATNSFDEVCRDQGPSSSFSSTCSVDGVQITQMFKDATLYVVFTRADRAVYHVDIANPWIPGSYLINFYTTTSGSTVDFEAVETPVGTTLVTISSGSGGTSTLSFTDLDDRLVTVTLDSYLAILDIHTTQR